MSVPRRFDHEEAVRRHQAGESYAALAREYGVSKSAVAFVVRRATEPGYADRYRSYHRDYQRETLRAPCVDGCGRLAWRQAGRPGRCPRCQGARRSVTVRPDTLLCRRCQQWLPDDRFPRRAKAVARRGRHSDCRACATEAKRDYRHRTRQPCSHGCGTLVDTKDRRDPGKQLECRPCSRRRIREERAARQDAA